MSAEIPIARLSDIPPGEGRNFKVEGRCIAIFHTRSGQVFATQPDCPHKGGPLADGLTGGTTIVCPLHERSWDLATGRPVADSDRPLTIYPVRAAADGTLLVGLPAVTSTPA
ncbi:Rieske (2Fe-2S) protein [Muricoccus pecuniae]|uniref:Nitrite reductase (NADH) small subunit n=1 Tax=Muricoccus pecuniae TaxID=693023 RepID=A0A840YI09_9PROT|nr:nitrite reductase (NAD(P)H) small subunit [Roseomonas pecuniae]MBB5696127.1 nitrite reductase (NADH) small subunit [Roseomonas pecuniae]